MSISNRPLGSNEPQLPSGTMPFGGEIPAGQAAMARRIRELEALCAEVYEAAVALGLPQPLLDKMWTVAARGNQPSAFSMEPLPDVPITDHPEHPPVAWPTLPPLVTKRSVLVVDDDPVILEMLLKILSHDNYELYSAESSEQALVLMEEHTPDLLITDLMMPGLSGSELANLARAVHPEICVLYQTGFTDTLFRQCKELEAGEAFLEKPFSARGLLEAARFVLFGTLNPDASKMDA